MGAWGAKALGDGKYDAGILTTTPPNYNHNSIAIIAIIGCCTGRGQDNGWICNYRTPPLAGCDACLPHRTCYTPVEHAAAHRTTHQHWCQSSGVRDGALPLNAAIVLPCNCSLTVSSTSNIIAETSGRDALPPALCDTSACTRLDKQLAYGKMGVSPCYLAKQR